ncbi:ATP-binding cassette domain-containing protein [Amnibacterium flavum]|uniref:ATP-binding cassette domain-containing protein n=1 Tax=Amnibacterium flavum TaxID=2173173 RepID=UPI001403AD81|nr:ATP-binding cassette domain-containing protein [Amnibacterium flavum]
MTALLQVENLVKTYPASGGLPFRRKRFTALDHVSISVDRGRTLGLVGESGSGKSTLGRCVLGLTAPDSGSVIFDGADVTKLRGAKLSEFRRRVQPVFQDPYGSLDPRWSVGRSVRESLDVFRVGTTADREQRVRDLFDRVGLNPALTDRLPSSLSGGQRQRVGIAAALASDPELIVADEPVSALDVSVQAQILNLFQDLQNDLGVATIFVTHDLGVVEHVSDDIAVLFHGELVEIGPADRILHDPQHDYTKRLLSAVPRPPLIGAGTPRPTTPLAHPTILPTSARTAPATDIPTTD